MTRVDERQDTNTCLFYKTMGRLQQACNMYRYFDKIRQCESYWFGMFYKLTKFDKNRYIVYADDINMLGENLKTVRESAEIFIKASKDIG